MANPARRPVIADDDELRRLIEGADTPVILTSAGGQTVAANDHASALLGYTVDELCQLPSVELFPASEQKVILERVRRYWHGELLFPAFKTRMVDKRGDEIPVQYIGLPSQWRGEFAYMSFLRDLRVEQKLEMELRAVQRLQSLGTLAGGIAHDFNNLLMAIQGTVSLLLMDIDEDHPSYGDLKAIEEHVRSGAKLTGQLLGYARQGRFETRSLDLAEVVHETCDAYGRTRKDITLSLPADREGFWICGDRSAIEQVLLNLLVNAGEAMPNGGELSVRLACVDGDSVPTTDGAAPPGRFVSLGVTDTGEGMDELVREHVFDPFFTTKAPGKGTGLGLSSVYGIVKRHGGYLQTESSPGQGTTFEIFLPASETPGLAKFSAMATFSGGSATILLIDDEEAILKLGERMLERLGYRVLTAGSGKEAVAVYEKLGDQVDVVILDMIMPGMSGEETYARLKKLDGGVRVLLSSGYSLEGRTRAILEQPCTGFVQKPYGIEALSGKISELLDEQGCRTIEAKQPSSL